MRSDSHTSVNVLQEAIRKAADKNRVEPRVVQRFTERVSQGNLYRSQNNKDHLCVFFLPYDNKTKKVFLGHHKKSDLWLPPGGHIEEGESPTDAVVREASEELGLQLENKDVEPFNLSITDIARDHPCDRHYDIWFLVHIAESELRNATDEEFHDAKWVQVKEAVKMLDRAEQSAVLKSLYAENLR